MKKLLIFAVLFLILPSVLADGGIWRPDNWEPLKQNEQRAVILYRDGLEKMIIAVDFSMVYEKAVWIFPVPAKPQSVVIDVVENFPTFRGTDANIKVGSVAKDVGLSIVYPFFIPRVTFPSYEYFWGVPYAAREGVTVHEHLEKEGVTAEIITAETGDVLYNYLSGKGLNVPRDAIRVFDSYVGKEYTFVVSWISASVAGRGVRCWNHAQCSQSCSSVCPPDVYGCCVNGDIGQCDTKTHTCYCQYDASFCRGCPPCDYTTQYCDGFTKTCRISKLYEPRTLSEISIMPPRYTKRGIMIMFPTDRIYYPMLPTSVYGSASIPINIYLIDYYSPRAYEGIKSFVKTSYYVQTSFSAYGLESFFGAKDVDNLMYTKVEMTVPSKYFTEDLWFEQSPKSSVLQFFVVHSTLASFALVVMISLISGAVTGLVVYQDAKKFAFIGLANVLTVIGLSVAILMTRTEKRKKFEALDSRKIKFLVMFIMVYVILSIVAYFILTSML